MTIQHYVINLKRRPDKLWAWIGAMRIQRFPLKKNFTIFEAIDAKDFKTDQAFLSYAIKAGFDEYEDIYQHILDNEKFELYDIFKEINSLKLGIKYLLKKIEKQSENKWTVIWLDDMVLKVPYEEFESTLYNAPNDAEILFFSCERNPKTQKIQRKKHPTSPFYFGTSEKSDHCFGVTPSGASKFLKIGNHKVIYSYEQTAMGYPGDTSHIYTCAVDSIEHIGNIFTLSNDISTFEFGFNKKGYPVERFEENET